MYETNGAVPWKPDPSALPRVLGPTLVCGGKWTVKELVSLGPDKGHGAHHGVGETTCFLT